MILDTATKKNQTPSGPIIVKWGENIPTEVTRKHDKSQGVLAKTYQTGVVSFCHSPHATISSLCIGRRPSPDDNQASQLYFMNTFRMDWSSARFTLIFQTIFSCSVFHLRIIFFFAFSRLFLCDLKAIFKTRTVWWSSFIAERDTLTAWCMDMIQEYLSICVHI